MLKHLLSYECKQNKPIIDIKESKDMLKIDNEQLNISILVFKGIEFKFLKSLRQIVMRFSRN